MLRRLQQLARDYHRKLDDVTESLERNRKLLETSLVLQSAALTAIHRGQADSLTTISDLEYKVFSQFGEDGIISFLASHVPSDRRTFIEFGVEDYTEANTRLILERDNWSGLVMDGSANNIAKICSRPDLWRYELQAKHAFVTRENINDLFAAHGMVGPIGLLSIDIDGNDYWIWECISVVEPLIVVCEYNSIFGPDAAITVPYDPQFVRQEKHFSHLYAGASLRALANLARQRKMRFLGCNRAGNNAFFIHESLDIALPFPDVADGYVKSRFREARDQSGQLILKTAHECLHQIEDLPVVDVVSGETLSIKQAMTAQKTVC